MKGNLKEFQMFEIEEKQNKKIRNNCERNLKRKIILKCQVH